MSEKHRWRLDLFSRTMFEKDTGIAYVHPKTVILTYFPKANKFFPQSINDSWEFESDVPNSSIPSYFDDLGPVVVKAAE